MKTLQQIQKENRKFILEKIHGCSYEEALQKELGFGCKIIVKRKYYSEGNTKFEWGQGVIIVDTSIYLGDINLKKGLIYTAEFGEEEIIEIIGKPLTLNRVLLAINICFLGNYNDDIWFDEDFANILHLDIEGISFDLNVETLEEQSEETQRAFNNFLHD